MRVQDILNQDLVNIERVNPDQEMRAFFLFKKMNPCHKKHQSYLLKRILRVTLKESKSYHGP